VAVGVVVVVSGGVVVGVAGGVCCQRLWIRGCHRLCVRGMVWCMGWSMGRERGIWVNGMLLVSKGEV
jgi:hypothetical protein